MLPLDKINEAAAREKSIRHGHPSTLHLWWAVIPVAVEVSFLNVDFFEFLVGDSKTFGIEVGVNLRLDF